MRGLLLQKGAIESNTNAARGIRGCTLRSRGAAPEFLVTCGPHTDQGMCNPWSVYPSASFSPCHKVSFPRHVTGAIVRDERTTETGKHLGLGHARSINLQESVQHSKQAPNMLTSVDHALALASNIRQIGGCQTKPRGMQKDVCKVAGSIQRTGKYAEREQHTNQQHPELALPPHCPSNTVLPGAHRVN